jgi:hypothetical protein
LLLSLVLHELALILPLFFCFGSLGEDSHVHECVEVEDRSV